MGAYHARLGPSSAARWTDCTASPGAQDGKPNQNSEASRLGTCCHQIGAECLEHGHEPSSYLGRVMWFPKGGHEDWRENFATRPELEAEIVVDQKMVEAVEKYVDYVHMVVNSMQGVDNRVDLIVEKQVPIDHITGEPDARGTSDAIVLVTRV